MSDTEAASTPSPTGGGESLSKQAYDRIRHDILLGTLFPGDKLQIDAVSLRYGIGTVPVREALNQLSSEGLVVRRNNRGFFVQTISITDLEELVRTRIWTETMMLRLSMANRDDAWEDALVVSYHRLARTHRRLPSEVSREASEEWEMRHKEFHLALLSQCGSRWLLNFSATLMDEAVRYRSLSMNTNPSRARREGAKAEHQAIMEAVLDHDTEKACELLAQHYQTTLEGLRQVMTE